MKHLATVALGFVSGVQMLAAQSAGEGGANVGTSKTGLPNSGQKQTDSTTRLSTQPSESDITPPPTK